MYDKTCEEYARTRAFASGLALLMGAGASINAFAVEPENGIYWSSQYPGRGYFIEHQKGVVSVIVYSYNEATGKPEWYLAAGPLRDDADEVPGLDPPPFSGYHPIHWMTAALYRYENGPCLVCRNAIGADGLPVMPDGERIGQLSLYVDYLKVPTVYVEPDAGQIASDLLFERVQVVRTNFGHREFGSGASANIMFIDLKGTWVFDSDTLPALAAVHATFGDPEVTDLSPADRRAMSTYTLRYVDETAGAMMECRVNHHHLAPQPDYGGAPRSGCELSIDGEVRFSALTFDIGMNMMRAFEGPLPAYASDVLRGELDILGTRIR